MKLRKKIVAGVIVALLAALALVTPATMASATDTNHADYWEGQYPGATCLKYEGAGSPTYGTELATGVKLKDVAGKNYITLIVKGGQNGYMEYKSPATGVPYSTPQNNNGKAAGLSHWIVCFQTVPDDEACTVEEPILEWKWMRETAGTDEVKEYRWEAIFKKGKELKNWEVTGTNTWTNHNDGQWYLLPDHKQPERFDGIAPTGNVALSVYGGPSGSTAYRYGETYTVYYPGPDASVWTTNGSTPAAPSGSSWGQRKAQVKTAAVPASTVYEWALEGDQPDGDGWVKTDVSRDSGQTRTVEVDCNDVCPNIAGVQTSVPNGLVVLNGDCVTPPPPVYICEDHAKVLVQASDPRATTGTPWDPATCGVITVVPTCDSITVTWPRAFDGQHINAKFRQLNGDGVPVGSEWSWSHHWDTNSPDNAASHTANFKTDPSNGSAWPGWTHFRITFIQANENDTWPDLDCGDTTTEEVCWEFTTDDFETDPVDGVSPRTGHPSTFPQNLVDCENLPPCVWVQKDTYEIDTDAKQTEFEQLIDGGVLRYLNQNNGDAFTGPADKNLYDSHVFIAPQDCAPICEWTADDGWGPSDDVYVVANLTEGQIKWTGNEADCHTLVTICELNEQTGTWEESAAFDNKLLKEGDVPWGEAGEDCEPPYVQICVKGHNGWGPSAWMATAPEDSRPWTGKATDCYTTEVVCWEFTQTNFQMVVVNGTMQPKPGHSSTFPQSLVDCDNVPPCVWIQKDTYLIDSAAKQEEFDSLVADGPNGEPAQLRFVNGKPADHNLYKSHVFLPPQNCAPICEWTADDGWGPSDDVYVVANLTEGQIKWTGDPEDCYTAVTLCEYNAQQGWHESAGYEPHNVPPGKEWTGNAADCYTLVTICEFDSSDGTWHESAAFDDKLLKEGDVLWGEAGEDCEPPYVQICVYGDNGWGPSDWMATAPEDSKTWTGNAADCAEMVTICELNTSDGTWVESAAFDSMLLKDGDVLWGEAGEDCGPEYVQYCAFDVQSNEWGASGFVSPSAQPLNAKSWTGRAIDCYPPVYICVPGDGLDIPNERVMLTEEEFRSGEYGLDDLWIGAEDGSGGCTPPTLNGTALVGLCEAGVPYLDWSIALKDIDGNSTESTNATITFVHPGNDRTLDVVYPATLADGLANGLLLWPGASEVDGVGTGWPGWALDENGTWINVGDGNFGWTRNGVTVLISINPEIELVVDYPDATPECDSPPVQICSEGEGGWQATTIQVADLKSTDKLWDDSMEDGGCADPQEPTLTGSFVSGQCVADAPWLYYDIKLNDPDGLSTDDGFATITFINPAPGGENYVLNVPIGAGYELWPGASVEPAEGFTAEQIDPTNADTFVPTGWPGWKLVDEEWVYAPDENYGWTRNGVDIVVEVNPSFTVSVNYPPPTINCVSDPEEITVVLGAPPLPDDEVVAVATYTG